MSTTARVLPVELLSPGISLSAASAALVVFVFVYLLVLRGRTSGRYNIFKRVWTQGHENLHEDKEALTQYVFAVNTQRWFHIGGALFSSCLGCWLVIAAPETGVIGGLVGVIAYVVANACPLLCMAWVAPIVKNHILAHGGFSFLDSLSLKCGRIIKYYSWLLSFVSMLIFLTVELTSLGDSFDIVTHTNLYPLVTFVLASVSFLLVHMGGALANIISDCYQGVLIALFVLVVVCSHAVAKYDIDWDVFNETAYESTQKWSVFGILLIAVTFNQFLEQSMWQKAFAAKTTKDLRWGFISVVVLISPVIFLFGFSGILGRSLRTPEWTNFVFTEDTNYASFFVLAHNWSKLMRFTMLAFATLLVATTVTALQSGLLALFGSLWQGKSQAIAYTSACCLGMNILAFLLSQLRLDVIRWFMMCNLYSCTLVGPYIFSFIAELPTTAYCVGIVSGYAFIVIFSSLRTSTFTPMFLLECLTLPYPAYDTILLELFVLVPLVCLTATLVYAGLAASVCRFQRRYGAKAQSWIQDLPSPTDVELPTKG